MENKNIYLSSNLKFLRTIKGKTQQEVALYRDELMYVYIYHINFSNN